MLYITDDIEISDDELEERFIRSPGSGGQNVNKVSTAVQLRFDALNSPAIPSAVFNRLKIIAGSRMSKAGALLIVATSFRTQDLNRKDARARMAELIQRATIVPKPRRKTKVSLNQKTKRLDKKKRSGATKKARGRVNPDSD